MENSKVVIIAGTKRQRGYPCKARNMYDKSRLFKKSLAYAQKISREIFVISAKHGIVHLDDVITPYETTMETKTEMELFDWRKYIIGQFRRLFDIENTEFILLTEENYFETFIRHLTNIRFIPNTTIP
jgi:cytoplasmic iron level regulating protein YaaA (DUF328/UPF0246 family)